MATFVPLPNAVTAELCFTYNGSKVENVMHFTRGSLHNDLGTMGLLAVALKDWWDTNLKAQVPTTCFLRMVRIWDASEENGPGIEYTTGMPIQGTAVSPGLPSNVTVSMKLGTGLRGRSYRGRIYHVGICENEVAEDQITEAFGNALDMAYSALMSPEEVNGYVLVVASKFHNGVARTTGEWTPVAYVSTDGYVDSQRRRLYGRGE